MLYLKNKVINKPLSFCLNKVTLKQKYKKEDSLKRLYLLQLSTIARKLNALKIKKVLYKKIC